MPFFNGLDEFGEKRGEFARGCREDLALVLELLQVVVADHAVAMDLPDLDDALLLVLSGFRPSYLDVGLLAEEDELLKLVLGLDYFSHFVE